MLVGRIDFLQELLFLVVGRDLSGGLECRFERLLVLDDTRHAIGPRIEHVEKRVEAELPHLNLELLNGLKADDVFREDVREIRLQTMDVSDAQKACHEEHKAEQCRGKSDSHQQLAVHVAPFDSRAVAAARRRFARLLERNRSSTMRSMGRPTKNCRGDKSSRFCSGLNFQADAGRAADILACLLDPESDQRPRRTSR